MPRTDIDIPVNKKLVFLSNTGWSIYKFRLPLINHLIAAGYEVYVLTPFDHYTEKFSHTASLHYIPLRHFESRKISPRKDYLLLNELRNHFQSIQPGLVFTYTIKANIFGSLAAEKKCQVISVITGLGYAFLEGGLIKKIAILLLRRALKFNQSVWFLNKDDLDVFLHQNLVVPKQAFLLPGEGVDPDIFYPVPYVQKEKIAFLMIGRLITHKGVLEYFEAARILKQKGYTNIECRLVGFYDNKSPIAISQKELTENTGNGLIQYCGETDDIVPFIEAADCIVLPSYREGLPLSLLEGASMCKALITTNVAGCREIVEEGREGYICEPKNATDLAAKMQQFISQPAEIKRKIGLAGREKVLRCFAIGFIKDIYLKKIADLIVHSNSAEPK